jgi:hypothetical protein
MKWLMGRLEYHAQQFNTGRVNVDILDACRICPV